MKKKLLLISFFLLLSGVLYAAEPVADSDPLIYVIGEFVKATIFKIDVMFTGLAGTYLGPALMIIVGLIYFAFFTFFLLVMLAKGRLDLKGIIVSLICMFIVTYVYGGRSANDFDNVIAQIQAQSTRPSSELIRGASSFFWFYTLLTTMGSALTDTIMTSTKANLDRKVQQLDNSPMAENFKGLVSAIDPNVNKKLSSDNTDRIFYFMHLLIDKSTCSMSLGMTGASIKCPTAGGNEDGGWFLWMLGCFFLLIIMICYILYWALNFLIEVNLCIYGLVGFVVLLFIPFSWGRPAFFGWLKSASYFVFIKFFMSLGVIILFYAVTTSIGDFIIAISKMNSGVFHSLATGLLLGVALAIVICLLSVKLATFCYQFAGFGEPPRALGVDLSRFRTGASSLLGGMKQELGGSVEATTQTVTVQANTATTNAALGSSPSPGQLGPQGSAGMLMFAGGGGMGGFLTGPGSPQQSPWGGPSNNNLLLGSMGVGATAGASGGEFQLPRASWQETARLLSAPEGTKEDKTPLKEASHADFSNASASSEKIIDVEYHETIERKELGSSETGFVSGGGGGEALAGSMQKEGSEGLPASVILKTLDQGKEDGASKKQKTAEYDDLNTF